jgi:hypothetical protein
MNSKRDSITNRNHQLIAGVQKHFGSATTILIDGVPMAPKDIVATFQAANDAIAAAVAAEGAFHDAVAAQGAAVAKAKALGSGLTRTVKTQLGSAQGILNDFGIQVSSRQVPSAATVALAVDKRTATRKARNTLGKRQKASIKGTVQTASPAPVPATVPATATPAPAAAPAAPSPPARS